MGKRDKKRSRFRYRPRDKAAVQKRANQSGGVFDSFIKGDFTIWRPHDGDNRIRFLPPTWDDAEHYGLDIFVHYGIGSDNQSYLCLDKTGGSGDCPICLEKRAADRTGDKDYVKELTATKRVLVWLIDRDDEDTGPQLWAMPWTLDAEYSTLCTDKRTRAVIMLDDPDNGFDVEFTKSGAKMKTKYTGLKVDRTESPLSDDEDQQDEWLAFIEEHPLADVLQFYDQDHIQEVAAGGSRSSDDDDEEDGDERAPSRRGKLRRVAIDDDEDDDDIADDEDDEPVRRRRSKKNTRRVPDDDDDDDDDDDEEEENNSYPTRGGRSTSREMTTSRSKSRRVIEDDDDDDDEEEEEPPRKQKKKKKNKKVDCIACGDTGRNSKGGFCVCALGKKLRRKSYDEDED